MGTLKTEPMMYIHPGRLVWNIIMEVWMIIFLSKWLISRFHVNLPGCTHKTKLKRLGFSVENIFSKMGWRKSGERWMLDGEFPIHGFISGSAFRVAEETLLNQSFTPKKLEHKLKHADKASMFLEVSERCFQHAFDLINVCAKLHHTFGMFGDSY